MSDVFIETGNWETCSNHLVATHSQRILLIKQGNTHFSWLLIFSFYYSLPQKKVYTFDGPSTLLCRKCILSFGGDCKRMAHRNGVNTSDPRKKFGGESSSEVRKMLGCLNCKYANCIFIRRRLFSSMDRDGLPGSFMRVYLPYSIQCLQQW